jgi:Domain of unknown function (DUF6265)
MRIPIAVILAVACVPALPASARADADPASALRWLAGCWASEGGEPGSGEQWMPPAGGSLLGVSRTVKGGRTVAHEFMQIREIAPGRLAFIANPSGQSQATFPLLRLGAKEVVFENARHDFPQRVIYRLDGAGVLRARIEGLIDGKPRAEDFTMRRVSCDSGGP